MTENLVMIKRHWKTFDIYIKASDRIHMVYARQIHDGAICIFDGTESLILSILDSKSILIKAVDGVTAQMYQRQMDDQCYIERRRSVIMFCREFYNNIVTSKSNEYQLYQGELDNFMISKIPRDLANLVRLYLIL